MVLTCRARTYRPLGGPEPVSRSQLARCKACGSEYGRTQYSAQTATQDSSGLESCKKANPDRMAEICRRCVGTRSEIASHLHVKAQERVRYSGPHPSSIRGSLGSTGSRLSSRTSPRGMSSRCPTRTLATTWQAARSSCATAVRRTVATRRCAGRRDCGTLCEVHLDQRSVLHATRCCRAGVLPTDDGHIYIDIG